MPALASRSLLALALATCISEPALAQAPAPVPVPAPAPAAPSVPAVSVPAPAPAPVPPRVLVAVFDTHALGVDPAAAAIVTAELRRMAEALGYAVVSPDAARAAVARLQTSGAVSSDRAAVLTRAVAARDGIFARLRSDGRAYIVELQVVSWQGGQPATVHAFTSAADLARTSSQLLSSVLPPAPAPAPTPAPAFVPAPPPAPPVATAPDRQPPPESSRYGKWRVALQTEAAFGIGGNDFYNHLAGARLDHRFTRRAALGAYVGYANLKGKEGRAHNVLSYALVEYRIPIGSGTFGVPLRYGIGYLPKNGPFMRTSAGIGLAASEQIDLVLDLLAPTVWLTHDEAVVSLDLAAEVALSF